MQCVQLIKQTVPKLEVISLSPMIVALSTVVPVGSATGWFLETVFNQKGVLLVVLACFVGRRDLLQLFWCYIPLSNFGVVLRRIFLEVVLFTHVESRSHFTY